MAIQASTASSSPSPGSGVAKSMIVVVPPWAAATVPVSKSSVEVMSPAGMSRCVCASMPPGITRRPDASITVSAAAGNPCPMRAMRPDSM